MSDQKRPPVAEKPESLNPERKERNSSKGLKVKGGDLQSRRTAALILDVLAGARTPSDAAGVMGVSLPRYYAIESRAISGLVKGCEPSVKGRRCGSVEKVTADLHRQVETLTRECARKQALLRAVQRSVALPETRPGSSGKGKRKRRPVVRALKASHVLQSSALPDRESPAGQQEQNAHQEPGE